MRRSIRTRRPSTASGLARRGQHFLQPLADEAAAADWAAEQVGIVTVVVLVVAEVRQLLGSFASRDVCRRLLLDLFGRTCAYSQHLGGADDAEFGWRIVDLPVAGRHDQRLCRRTAAYRDIGGAQ